MADIDPQEFGRLQAAVESLDRDFREYKAASEKQRAELQHDVKELLELANRGRGAVWLGMSLAAALGGIGSLVAERLWR